MSTTNKTKPDYVQCLNYEISMYNAFLHISSTESELTTDQNPLLEVLCVHMGKRMLCCCTFQQNHNWPTLVERGRCRKKGGGEGAETEKGRKGGRGKREVKEGNEGK